MKSINPFTNKLINEYKIMTDSEAESVIAKVSQAFTDWRKQSIQSRCLVISKLADDIRSNKHEYAKLITNEMGKPYSDSIAEIEKCALLCDYYSDNAQMVLNNQYPTQSKNKFVSYQPLGVILGIMPWNYPFWQVFRFAVPALIAGNCCVLKHADNVTGTALLLEKLFNKHSNIANIFRTVVLEPQSVSNIIENKDIKAVSFTGGTETGKKVAAKAGGLLKKTVLELGGNDPYIILSDANIDNAVTACAASRLTNCGQSCIAAKRMIVLKDVYNSFIDKLKAKFELYNYGDPYNKAYKLGPMCTLQARDKLHKQVMRSVSLGAECILGGVIPDIDGAFYPPTILIKPKPGMPAYDEELFGPVAVVIQAEDIEDAVNIANSSIYGLGGAVFSENIELATKLAVNEVETGSCFVNDFVKSDPALPFGGVKQSGYGRELSSNGLLEFVNVKTIVINK